MAASASATDERRPVIGVKPVYNLKEFCDNFGVSRSVAYEEIQAGRLRAFKLRGGTRITSEAALEFRSFYAGKDA
jgi:hypothetical protein